MEVKHIFGEWALRDSGRKNIFSISPCLVHQIFNVEMSVQKVDAMSPVIGLCLD